MKMLRYTKHKKEALLYLLSGGKMVECINSIITLVFLGRPSAHSAITAHH